MRQSWSGAWTPDLLLVGACSTTSEGLPGDHTRSHRLDARDRHAHGFRPATSPLDQLVALHLLLPDTATRRDLDDPATIERVARPSRTGALGAARRLTEAEAWHRRRVGPVEGRAGAGAGRAHGRLPGRPTTSAGPSWLTSPQADDGRGAREGRPIVCSTAARGGRSPDRTGLLWRWPASSPPRPRRAKCRRSGDEGVALEIFTVEVGPGSWPTRFAPSRLEAVFDHRLELSERLAARHRPTPAPVALLGAPTGARVRADVGASHTSTVIELRASTRWVAPPGHQDPLRPETRRRLGRVSTSATRC